MKIMLSMDDLVKIMRDRGEISDADFNSLGIMNNLDSNKDSLCIHSH